MSRRVSDLENIYQIAGWAGELHLQRPNLGRNSGAVAHIPGESEGGWVPGSCQNYNQHYLARNSDFSDGSGQQETGF